MQLIGTWLYCEENTLYVRIRPTSPHLPRHDRVKVDWQTAQLKKDSRFEPSSMKCAEKGNKEIYVIDLTCFQEVNDEGQRPRC